MTDRLYYRDPSLLEFESTVTGSYEQDGRYFCVLERSAFYPTSGGQLFDTGTLNGVPVIDVIDAGEEVHHCTSAPVGEIGTLVKGIVDGDRRWMHRQQHTAQHILSQSFIRLFGHETVSVHLGDNYGAIELDTAAVDRPGLDRAEQMANTLVLRNLPVEILFVSGDQTDSLPLRKVPSREGELRVVRIGDFDWSACGGTHCLNTGEVGLIKVTGCERMRNHSLVTFLAGIQAMEDYRVRFELSDSLSKSFTCHIRDLPGKIEQLSAENKALRKELGALQRELLPARAQQLAQAAKSYGRVKLAAQVTENMDAAAAGALAAAAADLLEGVVLLLAEGRLLIAVGTSSGLHAGELAKQLGSRFGLKGGGSSRAAQLGAKDAAKLNDYVAALIELVDHA